jgi:outer membrane receptor protein involved in Fe transport
MINRTVRERLLASTIIAGAFMAAPAMAQTAAADPAAPGVTTAEAAEPVTGGEIVVTGSLIRNPNLVSATPVIAVSESEILKRSPGTTEELLRSLPGVSPGVGTAVNNGANGTNTVDLRGLGSQRNVVLLDGSRIVPTLANGATDLNTIPLALVQRVDVLTGGASTTYGADAVSGVVNFITKKNFSGVDLRATYRLPERGDGVTKKFDLTVGGDFADGKGNAVLSIGWTKIDPIYQTRGFANYTVSGTSGAASGSSGTSTPSSVAFANSNIQVSPDGTSFQPTYQGYNFNPYNIFQTPLDRKSAYAQAHYDVADNIEVYARGMFVQNTIKSIIAPSGVFGQTLTINANNPYLNATKLAQLCAANASQQNAAAAAGIAANRLKAGSVDPRTIAAQQADALRYTTSCAQQTGTTLAVIPTYNASGAETTAAVIGNSIALPAVYRRSVELGPRVSTFENNIYDAKAGVRIGITEAINLDLGGSYGRSEQVQTQSGYVLLSRVQQGLNATNTTTCQNTSLGCVPLNLFGAQGTITPAMAGFLSGQSSTRINFTLKQAHALLTGDFGYTLSSAKDPISFAVGTEYRRYGYSRVPDATAQNPTELGGAGGAILPFAGSYDVKEVYGEVIAPIMSDQPFFQELSVEGGLRYSSYSVNAAGNPTSKTWTYKAGLNWAPVEGFRFRGNYQRAVRAPNINDLFAPVTTGLTTLAVDPCAGAGVVAGSNLANVCVAQGAPVASIGAILNPSSSQSNATGGGNVNIRPEKADTFTLGVVLTPRDFVPGLSISVDYYHIKINKAIAAATPGDVIGACFNSITAASATSLACTSIRRSPVNGRLSGSAATVPGLPTPLTNNGKYLTDGVDLTVDYTHKFGDVVFNANFVGNYTHSLKFQASPISLNRECAGYYSANCGPVLGQIQPKYSWQQRTGFGYENVNLSLLWRHLGKMKYEPGLPPLFSGVVTNAAGVNYALAGKTFNFNKIKAYNYFDLTAQVDVKPNLLLTFGVTNLLDKDPPLVSANAGTTTAGSGNTFPSTYDPIGRTYTVSARVTF